MNFSKVIAAGLICSAALSSCGTDASKATLKTQEDSVSYALGFNAGNSFNQNLENFPGGKDVVSKAILVAGFINGINGDSSKSQMTEDEATKIIKTYLEDMDKKEAAKEAQAYMDSKDENDAFLASKASEEGVKKIYAPGKDSLYIVYKETEKGTGASIADTSFLLVNYKGALKDGTVFDSNEGKDPVLFPVGGVIQGFRMALTEMNVGSKASIVIPSELGYGRREMGEGKIPANSVLMFDLEVVKKFNNQKEAIAYQREQMMKAQKGE